MGACVPASRRQMGPRASVSLPSCCPSSPAEASCCPHLCQPALAPCSPPSLPQKCSPSLPVLQPSGNTLLQEAFLTALSTGLRPALPCGRASAEPMARPGCPSLCVIPQATLGLSPSICKVGEALTMEPEGRKDRAMGGASGGWDSGPPPPRACGYCGQIPSHLKASYSPTVTGNLCVQKGVADGTHPGRCCSKRHACVPSLECSLAWAAQQSAPDWGLEPQKQIGHGPGGQKVKVRVPRG